jgi:hypothetical protein
MLPREDAVEEAVAEAAVVATLRKVLSRSKSSLSSSALMTPFVCRNWAFSAAAHETPLVAADVCCGSPKEEDEEEDDDEEEVNKEAEVACERNGRQLACSLS